MGAVSSLSASLGYVLVTVLPGCPRSMPFDKTTAYLCYDPRDPAQRLHDRSTWKRSDNAILVSATMLFAVHGEKCPVSWDKVAILADLCEDPDILPTADSPLATIDETNAMLREALARAAAPRPAGLAHAGPALLRRPSLKRHRARATPANRRKT